MQYLASDNIWSELTRIAKRAKPRLAAISYVSTDKFIKFGKGDLLVVDASDAAIAHGVTNAKVLDSALRRGAEVLHVSGLHAKIMVLGETAVVGSANMSESSANHLIEASFITDTKSAVGAVKSAVYQIAENAERIDAAFIKRIETIAVHRGGSQIGGKRKSSARVKRTGGSTWILGVQQLPDDAYPNEDEKAESGEQAARQERTWRNSSISWIRYKGQNSFVKSGKEGNSVIQVYTHLGKRRVSVYRHAAVLLRQKEPNGVTRFYVEESPHHERWAMTLNQFGNLLKRVGSNVKVGRSPCRCIDQSMSDELFRKWI